MKHDVCLVLEGSYPYVSGGVAACVQQLVRGLNDMDFAAFYIGTEESTAAGVKYPLPINLRCLQHCYLFQVQDTEREAVKRGSTTDLTGLRALQSLLLKPMTQPERLQCVELLARGPDGHHYWKTILKHMNTRSIWRLLEEDYETHCSNLPYSDFSYIWQATYLPFIRILATQLPLTPVYHALCTGYAGFAVVVQSHRSESVAMLTEHGLYDHERKLEIVSHSGHSYDDQFVAAEATLELKNWWIKPYTNITRLCYETIDRVVTLHEANRQYEIKSGAPKERCEIISNGLGDQFDGLRAKNPSWHPHESRKFRIGFVGRIVPIKDIRTLIAAVKYLTKRSNDYECWIVGNQEEDREYSRKCLGLVQSLELDDIVTFKGRMDVRQVYPHIDCLVLSSLSESQPLVILEASAAGVPVVATEVGACREMLHGRTFADKKLGESGLLATVGSPESIGLQIQKLKEDPALWQSMSNVGMDRIKGHYQESYIFQRYRTMYFDLQGAV